MTSDEIRSSYLEFFASKGHKIIPSSSLIPEGDPTLLLTTAGMVQFKPYFLGELVPPGPRLTSCQKCFRTTDIESVGDTRHLTFFEMLGNFSIGDYFKKEAIAWAWEYVTQRLKLPVERLWITVYLDDDESFDIWRKIGVSESRILRFGEKDNFWGPAGDSGPCGPCSEIHYDFGEQYACGLDCDPACGCGRFSEIWNLVFTQYNQDKQGRRTLLPKPNIDTGMGLERVAAVTQGKTTVYGTDLFVPLLDKVAGLSGKKYGSDPATDNIMRIIAEHGRSVTFLIGDGVIPGNEGRGYVLRRLLRRTVVFGRRLELDKPFLTEVAKVAIAKMGKAYPEIMRRRDYILQVIEGEVARFSETLSTGLDLLESIISDASSQVRNKITGEEAFKLYDTFGFPIDLTKEIAAGRGLAVDTDGFEGEMAKQRGRARAAHSFRTGSGVGLAGVSAALGVKETPFVGYKTLEHAARIIGLVVNGQTADEIKAGDDAGIILAETPFYGEMGGQAGDTGEIYSPTGRFMVTNTVHVPPNIILHQGQVTSGSLRVNTEATASVNNERRLDIARNHTATHLLQAALRQVVGEHVQQRGSSVGPDGFTFDFSHPSAVTSAEIEKVGQIVNGWVRRNLPVAAEVMPYKVAVATGAMALFGEKYGEEVRVLRVGQPPVSTELCGGTHISTTGEIGFFHVTGENSIGAGLRRIEAVTGRSAEAYIEKLLRSWRDTAQLVGASLDNVALKVVGLVSTLEVERKQREALERELAQKTAGSLASQAESIKGIKVLAAKVPSLPLSSLREMADRLRDELKSAIIVLGTVYEDKPAFLAVVTPDLVAKGYNAGEIIKKVAGVTGGGGGGRPNMAQAGGRDKEKLDEALQLVKTLI